MSGARDTPPRSAGAHRLRDIIDTTTTPTDRFHTVHAMADSGPNEGHLHP